MARYIITGNYTAAAMKGMLARPSDREAALRALAEAAGGELHAFYVTTGENDFMMVIEGSDEAGFLASLIVSGASGTVTNLKTARAFTNDEFLAAQRKAGELALNFKPAG